ncbi:Insect cuticle protein [Trinorchestia longiramus]|nr:Insect cuticle protein [Trinorchestia longiramus]
MFTLCSLLMLVVASICQGSPIKPPDATPPIYSQPQLSYGDGGDDFPANLPAPAGLPSFQAPQRPSPSQSQPHQNEPPKYAFDYAVQDAYSGVNFNQQEKRDGYNTQGAYYVALPDGRTQKVTYFVDGDSGYVPEVEYEGEAQYPQPHQQGYAK